MTAAVVALGVVVGLLAVLVVGLLRSHADILRALHDLGVGEDDLATPGGAAQALSRSRNGATADPGIRTLPGVAEPGEVDGDRAPRRHRWCRPPRGAVRIGLSGAVSPTLLAFLSTGCSTCADFWRAFGTDELDQVPGDGTRVVVVARGPEEESPAEVAGLASPRITTVMSSEAGTRTIPMSPYFVLVDGTRGVIGEGAAASWAQVIDLLGKAAADAGLAVDGRDASPAAAGCAAATARCGPTGSWPPPASSPGRPTSTWASTRSTRPRAPSRPPESRGEHAGARRRAGLRRAGSRPGQLVTVRGVDAVEHPSVR